MPSSSYLITWLLIVSVANAVNVSYNRPKLCPNATWYQNGTTIANETIIGNHPHAFFIDNNNNIYVVAHSEKKILRWDKELNKSEVIVDIKLFEHSRLFVTIDGDIYFEKEEEKDKEKEKGHIYKWTNSTRNSTHVVDFERSCRALFIDINNTIYCSIRDGNKVISTSLNDTNKTFTTVVGGDSPGLLTYQLEKPHGIFVDINFNIYVADTENGRIQRFRPGQKNGTTVAGCGFPQSLTLNRPIDVILDADNNLFIVENDHSRIIRIGPGNFQHILAKKDSHEKLPDQLNHPYSIRFDSDGNIYVADTHNHRIQKFTLATNSCDSTTIVAEEVTTISTDENEQLPNIFYPHACEDSTEIGSHCDVSNAPCNQLQPCLNNGTCSNNDTNVHGYFCLCPEGFNGTECQLDFRVCKSDTCFNDGTCLTLNATFNCSCKSGWEGKHCEHKISHCLNVTCENNGICRPLLLNYTCECLGNFYFGRHCEITATKLIIYKIISKSFAYIAIIAMASVMIFIIVMDVLKYFFGIDLTREEREQIRRKKLKKKRNRVTGQLILIKAPGIADKVETKEETVV
ncbi:unnamed protein product [Adineta steineri]|uniref:EGF-like domain-containing protein n=1 Tax=Adineta steineri TaxID=433720 RepID=A0A813RG70_9BILA|nr:unnamed protein product [Adineta steineri]CAF3985643.1 unnamed protein product [Adineta steineri]